ncbi:MAG: hypothetical protein AB1397_07650, partial [bacterium]
MATKVLSEEGYSGRWIRNPDGSYIRDTTGATATTRASIEQSEAIAPVGNSGGVPTHLHLEYNNGDDNPLLYVVHDPSNYSLTFQHPTDADDGHVDGKIIISHAQPDTERINTRINTTTGLDLNITQFYIDQVDDTHRLWRSCYGGRQDDGDRSNTQESNGRTDGIDPQSNGIDDFIYNWDSTTVDDGEHRLIAVATNVNNNFSLTDWITIYVDPTPPQIKKVRITSGTKTTKVENVWNDF